MDAHGRALRVAVAAIVIVISGGCAAAGPSATARTSTTPQGATPPPAASSNSTPDGTPSPAGDATSFAVRTWVSTYAPEPVLAVDAAGNAYLAGGSDGAALVKVDPKGALLARWAGTDTVPGQPDTIAGIAVDAITGDVWATDMTADRVVHLTADLVEQGQWGTTGAGDGQLVAPAGIAVDHQHNLVVVDTGNGRIQRFTPDGSFISAVPMPEGITAPTDVVPASDGTLLLSAAGNTLADGHVARVREDGSVVRAFHPTSTGYPATPKAWWFPDAFASSDDGILVADAWLGVVRLAADGSELGKTAIPGSGTAPVAARMGPDGTVVTLACEYFASSCVLATFAPDGAGFTQASSARLATALTPPGRLVDVNGHRLHVACTGSGTPTILWISGNMSPGWATSAQYLEGRLASISRFCTVDRLETGFSDRVVAGEEDMVHWMADLDDIHSALAVAGETGPFVPVGHSYGGLLARLFAMAYPAETAGMVAIDPAEEDQYDQPDTMPDGPAGCTDGSCPFLPDVQAVHGLTGGTVAGSLGALPLVVIGHDPSHPYWTGSYDGTWLALGRVTATASLNSLHVTATRSSHAIPFTQPALVVEAAKEVVEAARAADHTLPACGAALSDLGAACE